MRKVRKKNKITFFYEYKWWIVATICSLIVVYVIIYVCFLGNGFLPAGTALEKRDWLAFLGAYLSFAGTLLISIVAILQSRFFDDNEKKRTASERKKAIQPILSVTIEAVDSQIAGTAEAFNVHKPESLPKHKNVTILLENAGQYPICNVIVFDKYLWQMLKPNEKKQIQVAYSDSPDVQKWGKHVIELYETDYERSEAGIPKWFNVNYDDIDGNEMFQTYELKVFDGTTYYSLEGTYETGHNNSTLPQ